MTNMMKSTTSSGRGGAREGAGRKPTGAMAKKPLPAKVSQECRELVKDIAEKHNLSQAVVVEMAITQLAKTIASNETVALSIDGRD